MGEGKCSPGPWKAIENSWQYTTIYDAHDHEICRLDLERFEDLNEETQDKYEAIQRADAAAIVRACDHLAALRRAKAEGIRMVETYARAFVHERAVQLDGFTGSSGMAGVIRGKQSEADRIVDWAYACAAQIEEGE